MNAEQHIELAQIHHGGAIKSPAHDADRQLNAQLATYHAVMALNARLSATLDGLRSLGLPV